MYSYILLHIIIIIMVLQPFLGPWQLFSVSWSYIQSVGLLGRGISQSQARYLHTEQHKHRIKAHRHPCLEWDSKLMIPVFEWVKTVHALDRAATVLNYFCIYLYFFACFPYFEKKMKVGLCDLHAVCESTPINFGMPEPISMKLCISWHLSPSQRRTSYS
jgi:hypothetical protein